MSRITHVIFDCDGLLLDTEQVYTVCMDVIFNRYGKSLNWDVKSRMMGKKIREVCTIAVEAYDIPMTPEEYEAELKMLLVEGFKNTAAMPGAARLVKHLKQHGIPIAIATSSDRTLFDIKATLHHDWIDLFDVIVCGDDPEVKLGKPAPDLFLVAARRLKAPPVTSLVFEDAPNGMQAAATAGMSCVGVPDSHLDKSLIPETCSELLESLNDFDPSRWNLPPFRVTPKDTAGIDDLSSEPTVAIDVVE